MEILEPIIMIITIVFQNYGTSYNFTRFREDNWDYLIYSGIWIISFFLLTLVVRTIIKVIDRRYRLPELAKIAFFGLSFYTLAYNLDFFKLKLMYQIRKPSVERDFPQIKNINLINLSSGGIFIHEVQIDFDKKKSKERKTSTTTRKKKQKNSIHEK